MTKVKEITTIIEESAPLFLQEDYDNSGLVCGDPESEVTSILLTIDVTEKVIDEAIAGGHNLILSHHPLVFSGLKNILPDTYVKRCLLKAVRHNLNLYSAHTNLDAAAAGVSDRMADKLELKNRKILQPAGKPHILAKSAWNVSPSDSENPAAGFGIIGELQESADPLVFLHRLKQIFKAGVIRHTAICIPEIRRVAVCGGAGAFLTRTAIAQKADIFISGDFKYHDFFNAENRLVIADIGHYESEQFTKEIFYELVTKKLPNFAIQFSKVDTNPVCCL